MASATESETRRRWYLKNRTKLLAAKKRYHLANREARRAYHRAYYLRNKDEIKAQRNSHRISNPEDQLLWSARGRAKSKQIPFDLEVADIIIPEYCPVLGILLKRSPGRRGGRNSNSPSIDRVDNTKGYVKGNICVISWRANDLKRDGTAAEFRAIARYIERHRK